MFNNLLRLSVTQKGSTATLFTTSQRFVAKMSNVKIKFDSGIIDMNKGHLARLADSSATGKLNDTNVLVTIVNKAKYPVASFLPLTVDYLHKASAAGKIPSNFNRRDMGSSNYETLVSRMIDRSIRPLFPNIDYNNETQIVCNLLSYTGQDSPDILCINTVSYALYNSDIAWNGPVGCVRVGMVDNKFVANPSKKQLEKSPINIVLSVANNKNIIMIEAWGKNFEQGKFIEAIEFGAKEAYKIVELIKKSKVVNTNEVVTVKKDEYCLKEELNEQKETNNVNNEFQLEANVKLYEIFTDYSHDKQSRDKAIAAVRNQSIKNLLKNDHRVKEFPMIYNYQNLSGLFTKFTKTVIRNLVLEESKRVDGRRLNQLRDIKCSKDLYPSLHGSALFQRGQTQVLSTITFDSPESMYRTESISNMMSPSITNFDRNFMLHYEFPGYAVNEISRVGGRADRREIGHGALAEKSVYPMVPKDYPFTIRAQCEVLESNGSSSMASVCATSMALMDAGVTLKDSVCGVAMGIMTKIDKDEITDYKILTDISGFEDYYGDMDFKIAGTRTGLTAIQADFKIAGLPVHLTRQVIEKSRAARVEILNLMDEAISTARTDKKDHKPIIKLLEVPIEKRGKLIGSGGLNLRRITQSTGVTLTPVNETSFNLFAPNANALKEAEAIINKLIVCEKEPVLEFGGIYLAKITEIRASGLMIQFYPTMKPTLLPNNQLDGKKIFHGSVSDYKVGQELQVKYFGRDPVDGKMRVSRKAIFTTTTAPKDLFKQKN